MMTANADAWCTNLKGVSVGKFTLSEFIGAGKIGYVYKALLRDFPIAVMAIKLTFDTLRSDWDVELRKVLRLSLVEGIVHISRSWNREDLPRWRFATLPIHSLGLYLARRKPKAILGTQGQD